MMSKRRRSGTWEVHYGDGKFEPISGNVAAWLMLSLTLLPPAASSWPRLRFVETSDCGRERFAA